MTTLAIYTSAAFTNASGLAVAAGADVEVRRMDNGNLAVLWQDEAGTVTQANGAGAFTADSNGRFQFYAAGIDRGYSVAVTSGADTHTLNNQAIGTAAQLDQSALWLRTDSQFRETNLLVNPNWLLDQLNEGALYTVNGAAVQGPDGWSGSATGAGVFKLRTLADPENAALICMEITCTTADAAIAATDNYYVYTAIEGYDCGDLMLGTASAASLTLKFKAKFNVTGTYGISIANSATNRSYVGTIVVASTSEAEYTVTLTVDTTGTWLHTSGVGLYLRICLAAGSNFQTTAGAWAANNMFTTSAQANFMSSTANVAYIKRLILTPGSVALAYSQHDMQKDLTKAQRQYWKTFPEGIAVGQNAGVAGALGYLVRIAGVFNDGIYVRNPVRMRVGPAVGFYNPSAGNANWRNTSGAADSGSSSTQSGPDADGFLINNSQVGGDAVAQIVRVHVAVSARLS